MKSKAKKLFYQICWHTVHLFYPKIDVEGTDNLPQEPSIVVGNHSQIHGPIFSELYFPGKRVIWCAGEMMHMKEVPDYAYHDFWEEKPQWLKPMYRLLSYLIAPFASTVMRCADTIAVYRDTRIMSTFRHTIEKLRDGCHIIVFPECKQGYNQILCRFQENFVDVARLYYKKTGKELEFVPMYLAPKLRKAYFGTPVRFCHENPIAEERNRICQAIMDEITRIAVSLPEHTVIPYPNIPKKCYPKNHSSEAIIP